MADHPLLGANLKLKRAAEHIEEFRARVRGFIESNTKPMREYSDASGQRYVEYTFGAARVWPEISCPAGDALHNLRSALDHVAFAVAWQRRKAAGFSKDDLQRIYFSVRPTRKQFQARRSKGIERRIGPDWVAFLRSVQPYQRRNTRDLWRISVLDNIDKHRVLLRLAPFAEVGAGRDTSTWTRSVVPIEKGVVRVPLDADTNITMISPYVTFADAPVRKTRKGAEWELVRFHESVAVVIRAAKTRFF